MINLQINANVETITHQNEIVSVGWYLKVESFDDFNDKLRGIFSRKAGNIREKYGSSIESFKQSMESSFSFISQKERSQEKSKGSVEKADVEAIVQTLEHIDENPNQKAQPKQA